MKQYKLVKLKTLNSLMQAEIDDISIQINSFLDANTEYSLFDVKTNHGGLPTIAIFEKETSSFSNVTEEST
jgi:hypothetical protein